MLFLTPSSNALVQAMGIQRYMFFSIYNCDQYPEVPLMKIKSCTEKFLQSSGLNQTTFRLCGFHQVGPSSIECRVRDHQCSLFSPAVMQAVIGNYAVPILEDKTVWGTTDETRTAYLDSQDVARMAMAALRNDKTVGKTLTLSGPKAWSTREVIELCEDLADRDAKVGFAF